jgi:hypothetical protein
LLAEPTDFAICCYILIVKCNVTYWYNLFYNICILKHLSRLYPFLSDLVINWLS